MKRLLMALVAVGVLVAPAAAEARQLKPQDRTDAVKFAKSYWADRGYYSGDSPDAWRCNRVRTKVGRKNPDGGSMSVRGTVAYWAPWDPCRLVLNGNYDWSGGGERDPWWDLCATVIHEYGHLVGWKSRTGNVHGGGPNSIMAASASANMQSWWYPYFPACRYDGDDQDGDDWPDW